MSFGFKIDVRKIAFIQITRIGTYFTFLQLSTFIECFDLPYFEQILVI